jgi:hypothetical protein
MMTAFVSGEYEGEMDEVVDVKVSDLLRGDRLMMRECPSWLR